MNNNAGQNAESSFRALALTVVLTCFIPGCSTPFFWTDNPVLLYLPGAGRRSDPIPGYIIPSERIKLIREKGIKGAKAPSEEKDILLVQLIQEYEKTSSPHIRRAALDAVARISTNYANPVAEKLFQSALEDSDMALNLSAALPGAYASGRYAKTIRSSVAAISLLCPISRPALSIAAPKREYNAKR